MFCENCGVQLKDTVNFCKNCGAAVNAAPTIASTVSSQPIIQPAPVEYSPPAASTYQSAAPIQPAIIKSTATQYIRSLGLLLKIAFIILIFVGGCFVVEVNIKDNVNFIRSSQEYSYSYADVELEVMCDEMMDIDRNFSHKWRENSYGSGNTGISSVFGVFGLLILIILFVVDSFLTITSLTKSKKLRYRKWYSVFPLFQYAIVMLTLAIVTSMDTYSNYRYRASNLQEGEISLFADGAQLSHLAIEVNPGKVFYILAIVGFLILAAELYVMIASRKNKNSQSVNCAVM